MDSPLLICFTTLLLLCLITTPTGMANGHNVEEY